MPVVFIHGFSAESRLQDAASIAMIYGALPGRIAVELSKPPTMVNVSRRISLDDGLDLEDFTVALDRAFLIIYSVKDDLAVMVQESCEGTSVSVFSSAFEAVHNLLNCGMNSRGALVGQSDALRLLHDLERENPDLKVYLIGHSFGCRLVKAFARGPDVNSVLPGKFLNLLQAAFYHNDFGEVTGAIPKDYLQPMSTERRVSDPILVTLTKNDNSVGIAYVIALALADQNVSSCREPNDPYGAIGNNEAQHVQTQNLEMQSDLSLSFTSAPPQAWPGLLFCKDERVSIRLRRQNTVAG